MKKLTLLIGILIITSPHYSQAKTIFHTSRVCSQTKKPGLMSCHAQLLTDASGKPLANTRPVGYTPKQLLSAYNLSGHTGTPKTIAVIDAYDDPSIKNDLDTFSNQFGLSILATCAKTPKQSSVPCFAKVNQRGTSVLPRPNSGWAMEVALDVETIHGLCQNCSILLVEATSPNIKNLTMAVDTAVNLGADVVSNSYGGPELPSERSYDSHFDHPGVAFTVSSGDFGFGAEYPAASPLVTAVGGTSLYLNNDESYKDENGWSGAGSGCSAYEPKPAWQTDMRCKGRTVADVSAVADPATGVAIYSSMSPKKQKGWFVAGGTSLAAPIIAAVYALSGNIPLDKNPTSLPYSLGNRTNLHDVIGGSNGDCSPAYLCTSKINYDGPTGLGTPKGTTAF